MSAHQAASISKFVSGAPLKSPLNSARSVPAVIAENLSYSHLFEVLAKAEEVLGRKVNPTLYAAEDFSKKLRSDNHFLTRIVQQPKIMLIGDDNDLPTGNSAESGEDRQAQG